MARSIKELQAWAELLELCSDDCQVFSTTPAMRSAVLEVESELHRLHKLEDCAIRFARMLEHMRRFAAKNDDVEWDAAMTFLWEDEDKVCEVVKALVPEAFTEEAMEQNWREVNTEPAE